MKPIDEGDLNDGSFSSIQEKKEITLYVPLSKLKIHIKKPYARYTGERPAKVAFFLKNIT